MKNWHIQHRNRQTQFELDVISANSHFPCEYRVNKGDMVAKPPVNRRPSIDSDPQGLDFTPVQGCVIRLDNPDLMFPNPSEAINYDNLSKYCPNHLQTMETHLLETHKLVMPEHLNHYGYLFGGYMLKWVDEVAWIAASLDYANFNFVTIAMDRIEFHKSVKQGAILSFKTSKVRVGRTSVNYLVEVFRAGGASTSASSESIFTTTVTLVRVDENGKKTPIEA